MFVKVMNIYWRIRKGLAVVITEKILKHFNACEEGTNFFNTYFPNGIDTDKIKVTGDYNYYWSFIMDLPEMKLDYNGNVILKKCPDGDIWEFKYDDNNNIIWKKDPNGRIWEFKYDDNNNVIWEKDPDGDIYEWEFKYDDNNNCIWEKDPNGDIWEFKYDDNNNVIWEKDLWGKIYEWQFTVGKDNRLKEITRNNKVICSIEYLD
jgi:YD repeat-containing protein